MTPMPFEVELTNKILQSLLARGGFDSVWDGLDYDIKFEIKDEITEIIRKETEKMMDEYVEAMGYGWN